MRLTRLSGPPKEYQFSTDEVFIRRRARTSRSRPPRDGASYGILFDSHGSTRIAVLASLNHPNIATIHGFEESDTLRALVLELGEGPTLADRIARGPIPLEEGLPIARQIAEALEATHEHGIVHRDLKPANIKIRPDDTVKVVDFGLAKVLEPVPLMSTGDTASPIYGVPMSNAESFLGPLRTFLVMGASARHPWRVPGKR